MPIRKPFSIRPYVDPALAVLAVAALVAMSGMFRNASAEPAHVVPPPAHDAALASTPGTETAVVAGGCFWGVQGVFQHVKGVTMAVSGYSGGDADTAHYRIVGTGATGHAESVEITYDPSQVTYGKILQIYFSVAQIRRRRTARVRTTGPSTARRSSRPTRRRRRSRRTTSPSSTRPACFR